MVRYFWRYSADQLTGFGPQLNLAEAVALAQDGQGLVVGIEVVDIQGGDFGGPGPGVKEQMQQAIIPEALIFLQIHGLEDIHDFFRIQVADELFLHAFLRDGKDLLGQLSVLRIHQAHHLGQGFDGHQAQIAGAGGVFTILFQVIEEGDDQLDGEVFDAQRGNLNVIVVGGKGQQQPVGIAIGMDGCLPAALDVRQVFDKELIEAGRQFHGLCFWVLIKFTKLCRWLASSIFRYLAVCLYSLCPR